MIDDTFRIAEAAIATIVEPEKKESIRQDLICLMMSLDRKFESMLKLRDEHDESERDDDYQFYPSRPVRSRPLTPVHESLSSSSSSSIMMILREPSTRGSCWVMKKADCLPVTMISTKKDIAADNDSSTYCFNSDRIRRDLKRSQRNEIVSDETDSAIMMIVGADDGYLMDIPSLRCCHDDVQRPKRRRSLY